MRRILTVLGRLLAVVFGVLLLVFGNYIERFFGVALLLWVLIPQFLRLKRRRNAGVGPE